MSFFERIFTIPHFRKHKACSELLQGAFVIGTCTRSPSESFSTCYPKMKRITTYSVTQTTSLLQWVLFEYLFFQCYSRKFPFSPQTRKEAYATYTRCSRFHNMKHTCLTYTYTQLDDQSTHRRRLTHSLARSCSLYSLYVFQEVYAKIYFLFSNHVLLMKEECHSSSHYDIKLQENINHLSPLYKMLKQSYNIICREFGFCLLKNADHSETKI